MENYESRERIISEMKKNQKKNSIKHSQNLYDELRDVKRRAIMTEDEVNKKLQETGARVKANLLEEQIYSGNQLMDTDRVMELLTIIEQDMEIVSDEKKLSALILKLHYRNEADLESKSKRGVTEIDRIAQSGYGYDLKMQLKSLTSVDKNYHELYLKGVIDKKQFEECLSMLEQLANRDGTEKAFSHMIDTIKEIGIFNEGNKYSPATEPFIDEYDSEESRSDHSEDLKNDLVGKATRSLDEFKSEVKQEMANAGLNPEDTQASEPFQTTVDTRFKEEVNKWRKLEIKDRKKQMTIEANKEDEPESDTFDPNKEIDIQIEDESVVDLSREIYLNVLEEEEVEESWSYRPGQQPRKDDFRILVNPPSKSKIESLYLEEIADEETAQYFKKEIRDDIFNEQLLKEIKRKKKMNKRGVKYDTEFYDMLSVDEEEIICGFGESLVEPSHLAWDIEDTRSEHSQSLIDSIRFQENEKKREKVIKLMNVFGSIGKAQPEVLSTVEEVHDPERKKAVGVDQGRGKGQVEDKDEGQDGEVVENKDPAKDQKGNFRQRQRQKEHQELEITQKEQNKGEDQVKGQEKEMSEEQIIVEITPVEIERTVENGKITQILGFEEESGETILNVLGSAYMKKMPFMRSKTKVLKQEIDPNETDRLFEKKTYEYVYDSTTPNESQPENPKVGQANSKPQVKSGKSRSTLAPSQGIQVPTETKKVFGMELGKFNLQTKIDPEHEIVRIVLDYEQMADDESDEEILNKLWELKEEGLVSIKRQKGMVTFEFEEMEKDIIFTMDGFVSLGQLLDAAEGEQDFIEQQSLLDVDTYLTKMWIHQKKKNMEALRPDYQNPLQIKLQDSKFRQLADTIDGLIAPNLDAERKLARPISPTMLELNPMDKQEQFLDHELAFGEEHFDMKLKDSVIRKETYENVDAQSDMRIRSIIEENEIFDLRYYGVSSLTKELGIEGMAKLKERVEAAGGKLKQEESLSQFLNESVMEVENKEKERRNLFNQKMIHELDIDRRVLKEDALRKEKQNLFGKGSQNVTTAQLEMSEETEDIDQQLEDINKNVDIDNTQLLDEGLNPSFLEEYTMEIPSDRDDYIFDDNKWAEGDLHKILDNRLLINYEDLRRTLKSKLKKEPAAPWLERYIMEEKFDEEKFNYKLFLEGYKPRKIVHEEETVDTRMWGLVSGESGMAFQLEQSGIELNPYLSHMLENRVFVGEGNEYELYHLKQEFKNDENYYDELLHPKDELALQRRKIELKENLERAQEIEDIKNERWWAEINEDRVETKELKPTTFTELFEEKIENLTEQEKDDLDKMDKFEDKFKALLGFDYMGSDEAINEAEKGEYISKEITPDMPGWTKARITLKLRTLEDIEKDFHTGRRSFKFKQPKILTWTMIKRVMGKITETNKKQIPIVLEELTKQGLIEPSNPSPVETYVMQFEDLLNKIETCKATSKTLVDCVFGENIDGLSFHDAADDEEERWDYIDRAFYATFLGHQYQDFNEVEINNHNENMMDYENSLNKVEERNDYEVSELNQMQVNIQNLERQGFFEDRKSNFETESEATKKAKELSEEYYKMIVRSSEMREYSAETPRSYEINKMVNDYTEIKKFHNTQMQFSGHSTLYQQPRHLQMIGKYYQAVADGLPQHSDFVQRMKKFFGTYETMRHQQYFHSEKKQVIRAFDKFLENEFTKLKLLKEHQWSFTREMKRTMVRRQDGLANRDFHDWMNALDLNTENGDTMVNDNPTFEELRKMNEPDDTSEDVYESEEEKLLQNKRKEMSMVRHRLPDGRYVMTNSYSEKDRRVTKRLKEFFGRDHPALVFEGLLECEQRLSKQMRNRVYETTQKLLPGSLGKMTAEKMFYLTIGHPTITAEFEWMDGADPQDVRLQLFVGYQSPEDFFKPGETPVFEKRDEIKKLLLAKFAQKNGKTGSDFQEIEQEMLENGLYQRYLRIQKELFTGLYERLGFHSQTYVIDKVQTILNSLVFSNIHMFSHLPLESLRTAPAFGVLSEKTEELLAKAESESFDIIFEMAFANEELSAMGLEEGKPISNWTTGFGMEHVAELLRLYQTREISQEVLDQHLKAMEEQLISKEEAWSAEHFAQLKKLFSDLSQLIREDRVKEYLDSADLQHSLLSGGSNLGSVVEAIVEKEMRNLNPESIGQGSGLVDEIYSENDLARIRNLGEEQIRLGQGPVKFSDQRDAFQEFFFNKYHDDVKLLFIKKNWNLADDSRFTDYQNRAFRSMVRELGLVKDIHDTPILDPRPFNSTAEMKDFLVQFSKNASTKANSEEAQLEAQKKRELNEKEKDFEVGERKIRSLESVSATVQAQLSGELNISPESGIEDPEIQKDQEDFKNVYLKHAKASQEEQKNIETEKAMEAQLLEREEKSLNSSFLELEKVFKKYSKRVMRNISDNKSNNRFPFERMLSELSVSNFNCLSQVRTLRDLNPSNFRNVFELYLLRRHPRVKEVFEKSGLSVDMVDGVRVETDQRKEVEDFLLKGVDLKLPMIEEMARIYFSVSKAPFQTSEVQMLTNRTGKVYTPDRTTRVQELDPNFVLARRIVNSPFFEMVKNEVQSPDAERYLKSQELRANDQFKINVYKDYEQTIIQRDFVQKFG